VTAVTWDGFDGAAGDVFAGAAGEGFAGTAWDKAGPAIAQRQKAANKGVTITLANMDASNRISR
jgi:hypothetical protein